MAPESLAPMQRVQIALVQRPKHRRRATILAQYRLATREQRLRLGVSAESGERRALRAHRDRGAPMRGRQRRAVDVARSARGLERLRITVLGHLQGRKCHLA